MIYIERTIKISKNTASIDDPIYLYKGDKNIEIRFAIENNPFKNKNNLATNYGQLIIQPENAPYIFSEVTKMTNGKVIFAITDSMIDELHELGNYRFQIRIYNEDMTSRGTLPPVEAGIVIREPICEETAANTTYTNNRKAIVPTSNVSTEAFDDEGNYNKTNWSGGQIITDTNLNKIETAIYTINDNVTTDYSTTRYVDTSIADLEHQVELTMEVESTQIKEYMRENYSSRDYVDDAIRDSNTRNRQYVDDMIGSIEGADLTGYATESFVNDAINNVELIPGPQGEPGPEGPMGPQGEPGKDAEPVDLTGYATEDYVYNYTDQALIMIEEILCEGEVNSLINNILGEAE